MGPAEFCKFQLLDTCDVQEHREHLASQPRPRVVSNSAAVSESEVSVVRCGRERWF